MTTVAKAQPQPTLSRPFGFIFIILAIVALWVLNPFSPTVLALAVIVILLLLGLRRPVWAMSALIVSQLTITSYMISTPFGFNISLRLVLLILIGLILFRSYRQGQFEMGPKAKILLIPTIVLIVIAMISDFTNSGFDVAYKDFRDLMTGLMILSFIPIVVRNTRDLIILCAVAFIGITASSLIGIMQHFNILGMQSISLTRIPTGADYRIPGTSETGLELSYVLSAGLIILAGIFLFKGFNPDINKLIPVFMLLISIGLYFTYTRSALIAVVFGLASLVLLIKTRIKGEIIFIVLLLIAGFLIISPVGNEALEGRI